MTLHYDKLDKNQFRLLQFEDNGTSSELQLNLVTAPLLSWSGRPAYEAISYVWGNSSESETVFINNKSKAVSRSLFQVLALLRRWLSKQKLFWVDALCINQEDNFEKGFQIQAMGPIYKFADLVHIFLGQDYSDADILTAKELLQVSDRLVESPLPGTLITYAFLESRHLPSSDNPVWSKLGDFFRLPWFQRLWVVQEAALANELVVHLSDGMVLWTQLMDLIERLNDHSLLSPYLDEDVSASYCQQSIPRQTPGYESVQLIHKMRSRYLHQHTLLAILHLVRKKLCRDAVDRVYAWIWLLSESLRAEITPRYRINDQTPFSLMYIELSHIALAEYRNLVSLQMACTAERLPSLPSWCINLGSDADSFTFATSNCKAGGEILTLTGPHFATSRRGHQIYLRGIEICQVVGAFAPRWLDCAGKVVHPDCAASWVSWLSQCMDFVNSNCIGVEHLLRTLVLDRLCGDRTQPMVLTDLRSHYKDLIEHWCQCATGTASGTMRFDNAATLRIARIEKEFVRANTGRRLLVTSLKTLCLGHHTARIGDRVCVFEGASAPLLLRPKGNEAATYTFVSDAWVLGFMNGEAFQKDLAEQIFVLE